MDKLKPPAVTARRAARSTFRFAALTGGLMILLSGCTDQRTAQLEERLTAVETKAEAAEKRSKSAEAIALRSTDSPPAMEVPPPTNDDPSSDDDSQADAGQVDGLEDAVPPSV